MVVADLSAVGVIKLRRGPVSWAERLGNGGEEAAKKTTSLTLANFALSVLAHRACLH
jgi:hypothetical protein